MSVSFPKSQGGIPWVQGGVFSPELQGGLTAQGGVAGVHGGVDVQGGIGD